MKKISPAARPASHELRSAFCLAAALLLFPPASAARADEKSGPDETDQTSSEQPSEQPSVKKHPLDWAIRYAEARFDYIRDDIEDYTCRLVKRERIGGELQDYQHADVWVRCQQSMEDQNIEPLSVYMEFLAPPRIRGRRLLYVEGRHDNQVLVRKGGALLSYVRVRIDPNGAAAKRESNYPISDIGMDQIIERLIDQMRQDIRHDPDGANTKVATFRSAKVKDRTCTHIRVTHPKKSDGLTFHRASLYVDDQLHVPIRLVAYDWPKSEDDTPDLIEEYNYLRLRLNVGLTNQDFNPEKLGSDTPEDDDDAKPGDKSADENEKPSAKSNNED